MTGCWKTIISEGIILPDDVLSWLGISSDVFDFYTKLRASCEDYLERNEKCSRLKLTTVRNRISHVMGKYYGDNNPNNVIRKNPSLQKLCSKVVNSLTSYPTTDMRGYSIFFNTLLMSLFDTSIPRHVLEQIANRSFNTRIVEQPEPSAKKSAEHILLRVCLCWVSTPSTTELSEILRLIARKGGSSEGFNDPAPATVIRTKRSEREKRESALELKRLRKMKPRPKSAAAFQRITSNQPEMVVPKSTSTASSQTTDRQPTPKHLTKIKLKTSPSPENTNNNKVPSWCFIPPKNKIFRGKLRPGSHGSEIAAFRVCYREENKMTRKLPF